MKYSFFAWILLTGIAGVSLAPLPTRAATEQLSPDRLDALDRGGVFTPKFKAAVRNLVEARHAVAAAKADQLKLTRLLPDLKAKATEAETKTAALREELAKYDHPDETDFTQLESTMNDAKAAPGEQMALAQAYVWSYAASPHAAEAQQYLQKVQKKVAEKQQADKDAEAARLAARAQLVQRARAHDLSLNEWREFLEGMSQDELTKYLGQPDSKSQDYWIYSRAWVTDPTTGQKAGMEINFTGGRVLSVFEAPAQ